MTDYFQTIVAALSAAPDQTRLIAADGTDLTGADLAKQALDLRAQAGAMALKPAHRIATLLPDHSATGFANLCLCHLANLLPLNPALTLPELQGQAEAAGIDAIVAETENSTASDIATYLGVPVLNATLSGRLFTCRSTAIRTACTVP